LIVVNVRKQPKGMCILVEWYTLCIVDTLLVVIGLSNFIDYKVEQ
jgi:hypothetical protein